MFVVWNLAQNNGLNQMNSNKRPHNQVCENAKLFTHFFQQQLNIFFANFTAFFQKYT